MYYEGESFRFELIFINYYSGSSEKYCEVKVKWFFVFFFLINDIFCWYFFFFDALHIRNCMILFKKRDTITFDSTLHSSFTSISRYCKNNLLPHFRWKLFIINYIIININEMWSKRSTYLHWWYSSVIILHKILYPFSSQNSNTSYIQNSPIKKRLN